MHSQRDWRAELSHAITTSRAKFDCSESVGNQAHAEVAIALLRAFAEDDRARIYAEPRTPLRRDDENAKPADLLLLHPEAGALLIEVKGWSIDFIESIEAGSFLLRSGERKNPLQQVKAASVQLQNASREHARRRRLSSSRLPFFECVLAFPHIRRTQWESCGFHDCLHKDEMLLADDFAGPSLPNTLFRAVQKRAGSLLPCTEEQLSFVRGVLGSSYVLRGRQANRIGTTDALPERLSDQQSRLMEARFDGRPQLIRGVAGSGKTTVLVGNCARLVDRLEQRSSGLFANESSRPRVAIVCYDRALVPFIRRQFDESYLHLTGRPKPDLTLHICNINALMYRLSKVQSGPLTYLHTPEGGRNGEVKLAANARSYLEQVQALSAETLNDIGFDAIYVDEGQDLLDDEYRTLVQLTRIHPETGDRNIVVCYDDAQNVYARPRPTWRNLDLEISGRSVIMRRCFRNSKETLNFAINVLLGATAAKQAGTKGFADAKFLEEEGLLTIDSDRWIAHFAERSGAQTQVELYGSRADELNAIKNRVRHLLQQGIPPEHLLLLFTDDRGAREFTEIANWLRVLGCQVLPVWGRHVLPDGTHVKDTVYFEPETITIGTLQSLKGQDAPHVLLMGADLFQLNPRDRAAFYVAATRARTQLFVTGLHAPGTLAVEALTVMHLLSAPRLGKSAEFVSSEPSGTAHLPPDPSLATLASRHAAKLGGRAVAKSQRETPLAVIRTEQAFSVGDQVMHPTRGVGVLTACDPIRGGTSRADQFVTGLFASGVYRMKASIAGLRLHKQEHHG